MERLVDNASNWRLINHGSSQSQRPFTLGLHGLIEILHSRCHVCISRPDKDADSDITLLILGIV